MVATAQKVSPAVFHLMTSSRIDQSVPKENHPSVKCPLLACKVDLGNGAVVAVQGWGDNIIVGTGDCNKADRWSYHNGNEWVQPEEVEPFVTAEVVGEAFHKMVPHTRYKRATDKYGYTARYGQREEYTVEELDRYNTQRDYGTGELKGGEPWNYLKVRFTTLDGQSEVLEVKFRRAESGTALVDGTNIVKCTNDFFGLTQEWELNIKNVYQEQDPRSSSHYTYDYSGYYNVYHLLKDYDIVSTNMTRDPVLHLWESFLNTVPIDVDNKGVKALEKRKAIKPSLDKLAQDEPVIHRFYQWIHNSSGSGGISNNNLIAAFLKKHGDNYAKLKKGLLSAMDVENVESPYHRAPSHYDKIPANRKLAFQLPGATERHEEKLAKKQWQFRKGLKNQAEGLGVTKESHPKLLKAMESGDIPIGVFHAPSDKDTKINIEFDLWEKALKRKGWQEVLSSIAKSASSRKQYSKNVTPFISFLFKIEKYLDKHTPRGKKWRAMPKFVNSQWELEMSDAADEQTTKRRSALTPVADNENRIITVPYASLAIYGRQTTYCYSLNYYVYEDGFIDPESETPVVNALEKKLNGRDDYGLMFYTLTGSPTNRGYPAFLIIFERLSGSAAAPKNETRVHFHRVHPSRHRNGQRTPACQLIKECYRYMAGNVEASEIHAQQGDLIFIKCENSKLDFENEGQGVESFESHAFIAYNNGPTLKLIENKSRSVKNRLGHIYSGVDFVVDHPEHDSLEMMPAGVYEIRRCKSWEANPTAVWSLTID
jgi:hypothetical protein